MLLFDSAYFFVVFAFQTICLANIVSFTWFSILLTIKITNILWELFALLSIILVIS